MSRDLEVSGIEQGFNTAGQAISQGKTIQAITTPYATAVAVQKPRSLTEVEQRCVLEARIAGESLYYRWGAGDGVVEGKSIECAMIALRNWGNAAAGAADPVFETDDSYVFTSMFVDLETGVTYKRQFRQSKTWKVYGKLDAHRKEDIRFQIGQSKSDRNVILRSLPVWLFDKMMEAAQEGVRDKIEKQIKKDGIEKVREAALRKLADFGVSKEFAEAKYGKKYNAWDIIVLVGLKGDISALTQKIEDVDTLFPNPASVKATGKLDMNAAKAGDPKAHQGHEPEKPELGESPKKETVKPAKEKVDPETGEVTEPSPEAIAKAKKMQEENPELFGE